MQRKFCSDRCRRKRWAHEHKDYHAAKVVAWRKKHPGYLGPKRQAIVDRVDAIKETTVCADCGGRFPACCMDFDHKPGTKHNEVGTLIARSSEWKTIQREIEKCDVVCANCHRIRTKKKGSNGWTRKTLEKDELPKTLASQANIPGQARAAKRSD